MLYTNFESMYALDRVLPILRKINSIHLLVVVFFENTEIKERPEKCDKEHDFRGNEQDHAIGKTIHDDVQQQSHASPKTTERRASEPARMWLLTDPSQDRRQWRLRQFQRFQAGQFQHSVQPRGDTRSG